MLADAGALLGGIARELTLFAGVGLLAGGLDDLIVDLLWIGRGLWRRAFVFTRFRRASMATLPPPAQPGRLAILIACWHEEAVIGHMLARAVATLRHDDYLIYVGTYPNDPGTVAAIEAVRDPRIRLVGGDLPGPTTKAECLNRAWRAVLADESAEGVRCKAIVLHDAEDMVHPLELRLYDRMIERFDLVQIPVLPLPDRRRGFLGRMISSTYADEFADAHGKTLSVREAVGAAVPSAGVGCAIARDTIERIAAAHGGLPFDPTSLTEDYEIGLKLKAMGARSAFVSIPIAPGGPPVAVRAHFPDTFHDASRQKARWMQGIALAGWDRLKWEGGFAERWMRLRDRRAVLAALILAAAYAGFALDLLCLALGIDQKWPSYFDALLWATTALLVWRLAMRALMVTKVYGWREGLWAVPRVLLSNLIAMAAAVRAIIAYVPGAPPRWDKTAHVFPEVASCD